MKKRLLDLCSCAGGAAKGYQNAGFEVVGVDINPQPNYIGDDFIQGDAVEIMRRLLAGEAIQARSGKFYRLSDFDAIHASPPCQLFTTVASIWRGREGYDYDGRHPDLVSTLRELLILSGLPYVIENVPGAPLIAPSLLCGLSFNLKTIRHRLFETSFYLMAPPHLNHPASLKTNSFRDYSSFEKGATHITVAGHNFKRVDGIAAFGDTCEWMTRHELAEAVPPSYTEFIGRQLIGILEANYAV